MDTTNPTNTTNTTSPVRGVMTYFMGAIAVLTCPCHLPILILLLSGTAAGAFLSENLGLAVLILLPIFLLSAIATWRLLDKSDSDKPANTCHAARNRATAPAEFALPGRKDRTWRLHRP